MVDSPLIKCGDIRAIDQMQTYKPAEHEETASVAPLMQFFELVHIADTIQSMIQVFFDKELVSAHSKGYRSFTKRISTGPAY